MVTAKKTPPPSAKAADPAANKRAASKGAATPSAAPASKPATKPAAKKTATQSGARRDDALALLIQDHKAVKKLFKQYDKLAGADGDDGQKQDLARLICAMLKQHTTIEEEIFYPAAREALPEPDLLDEAEVEHASAKDLIAQIEASSPADSLYDAKVHVLAEYIAHHVTEEEEEMFPKLRRSKLDLVALGEALKKRKEELTADEGMQAQPA